MAKQNVRIAVGQMDCTLGDVPANLATIERLARDAIREKCDLILFPELAATGYAVGPRFADSSLSPGAPEVGTLKTLSREIGLVVGFIEETEDIEFFNSAMFLHGGEIRHVHRKIYLPNYRVFDERRYFGAGNGVWAFDTPWCRMAILICGDAWHLPLPYLAAHDGADVLLVIAASSTEGLTPAIPVRDVWEHINYTYALTLTSFLVFANRVGIESPGNGTPDLQFWGGSHIYLPDGRLAKQAKIGEEDLLVTELDLAALRRQRLILPFRRDDSLSFTLDVGRRVLRAKSLRRDGFFGLIHTPMLTPPAGAPVNTETGSRLEPPPLPNNA